MVTKEKLAEFFDTIEDIENKNLGGCLFFCYVFWKWLKKNGFPTDTFEIVQYGSEENTKNNLNWIVGNLNEKSPYPQSAAHFTWIYNGTEYDSEGEFNTHDYIKMYADVRTVLTGLNTKFAQLVEAFCEDALIYGNWNCYFDRSEAIDLCSERFGIDLSEL